MNKYIKIIGLGIFVIILAKVDFLNLLNIVKEINFLYMSIAFALIFPVLMIKAWRWQYLLKLQNIIYPYNKSFLTYLKGFYLGLITPGRIGEFSKTGFLKSEMGIPLSKSGSSVFADKFIDMLLLMFFGSLGLSIYFENKIGLYILVLSLLFLIMFLSIINSPKNILRSFWSKIGQINQNRILLFFNGLKNIVSVKIIFAIFLTVLAYALFFLQGYFVALAIGMPLPILFIVFSVSSASLAASLPISIWGIGTREAVFIFAFKTIGIGMENALSFSFLLFTINYLCCGFIGLLAWLEIHNKILFLKTD